MTAPTPEKVQFASEILLRGESNIRFDQFTEDEMLMAKLTYGCDYRKRQRQDLYAIMLALLLMYKNTPLFPKLVNNFIVHMTKTAKAPVRILLTKIMLSTLKFNLNPKEHKEFANFVEMHKDLIVTDVSQVHGFTKAEYRATMRLVDKTSVSGIVAGIKEALGFIRDNGLGDLES